MKVLVIHEDDHGVIGVARYEGEQAKWAVELLIKRCWLDSSTHVWYETNGDWQCDEVSVAFGENWEDCMKNLTIDEFNELWDERFFLEVYDIYGINNATIY